MIPGGDCVKVVAFHHDSWWSAGNLEDQFSVSGMQTLILTSASREWREGGGRGLGEESRCMGGSAQWRQQREPGAAS